MGRLNWSFKMLFILSESLLLIVTTTVSQPQFFHHNCSNIGNYTNTSPFKKNLDTVLASISTNSQVDKGFYAIEGEEPNRVTAMALCRGPVPPANCTICVKNAAHVISQTCPNQMEAAGWYHDCQILYSNKTIQGVGDTSARILYFNTGKASDPIEFNQALGELLNGLRQKLRETGTPTLKSEYGVKKVPNSTINIYGLLDCFPDLSSLDCDICLIRLESILPSCCNASLGARFMAGSCQLNYEIVPIYAAILPPLIAPPPDNVPFPSMPPTQTPGLEGGHNNNNKSNKERIVKIVVSSTVSVSILISLSLIFFLRKRNKKQHHLKRTFQTSHQSTDEIISIEMLQFDFETIKLVTNGFSSENKIGQGGFGAVYKGKLPSGQEIAVKRLAKDSQQGDVEFRNEVLLVAKLHHRNLVRLLGFCLQKNERLLIYEFVPNASLDHFIFDFHDEILLDWKTRYKIINGIARGLLYLHEDSRLLIIHRDLKASNILLDEKMNPKIADFGTARMFEINETHCNTNRIVGTYGYMAPEYALDGQFSVKSDVFSFGVLILEIISGQKNICFRNGKKVEDLSSFAWKNWRAGRPINVIDPKLKDGSTFEMMRCIHIGLLCVQENAVDRPTMASVVLMLSSSSLTLSVPSEPAFFMHSNIEEANNVVKPNGGHMKSTSLEPSLNEVSITALHPR